MHESQFKLPRTIIVTEKINCLVKRYIYFMIGTSMDREKDKINKPTAAPLVRLWCRRNKYHYL